MKDFKMPQDVEHGPGPGYVHYGCRCASCKEANRTRHAQLREQRRNEPKDPSDARHGKPSFYVNHGCRCEKCLSAYSEKNRAYRQRVGVRTS